MKRTITLLLALLTTLGLLTSVAMAQEETEEPNQEMMSETEGEDPAGICIVGEEDDAVSVASVEDLIDDEFDPNTHFRFAHFAEGADAVDIYVNNEVVAEGVEYGSISPWFNRAPGGYDIAIVPAGTAAEDVQNMEEPDDISSEDMMSAIVESYNSTRGVWNTLAVVIDNQETLAFVTATEDFSEPLPGTSNITFLNGLSVAGLVNFQRDGVPFITDLGRIDTQSGSYAFAIPVDSSIYDFSAVESGSIVQENPEDTEDDEDTGELSEGVGDSTVLGEVRDQEINEFSSYLIAVIGSGEDAQIIVDETTRGEWLEGRLDRDEMSLIDVVCAVDELVPYARLFELSGLNETIDSEGPFTLFLPAGFLADEVLGGLTEVPNDDETVPNAEGAEVLLSAHLVEGEQFFSSDLIDLDFVTMSNDCEYPVIVTEDNTIAVGGARVIDVNIPASNGVIHILGDVIDPSPTDPETGEEDCEYTLEDELDGTIPSDPETAEEIEDNINEALTEEANAESGEQTDMEAEATEDLGAEVSEEVEETEAEVEAVGEEVEQEAEEAEAEVEEEINETDGDDSNG